jgi:hypothetical protein
MYNCLASFTSAGKGKRQTNVVRRPVWFHLDGLGVLGNGLVYLSALFHRQPEVDPGRYQYGIDRRRGQELFDGRFQFARLRQGQTQIIVEQSIVWC